MSPRERNLLIVFLGLLAVAGGSILFHQSFIKPLQQARRQIEELDSEVQQKERAIRDVVFAQKRLEKYKAMSLPSNPELAASEYAKFLQPLLTSSGLTYIVMPAPPPAVLKTATAGQGKKPGHLTLTFTVSARGNIGSVIETLAALRRAPIAHRVRGLSLQSTEGTGKDPSRLNVQMTIEALIVNKAENSSPFLSSLDSRMALIESIAALRRAPVGLAMGAAMAPRFATKRKIETAAASTEDPSRDYLAVADRNPFLGAPLPIPERQPFDDGVGDIRAWVRLVHTNAPTEAFLRNLVFRTGEIRLRPKSPGFSIFQIKSENLEETLLRGKALRVDQRDVFFQVGEDVYRLHIGQSLAEAMRRPMSGAEMEELELTADEEFAEEELRGKGKAPGKAATKGGNKAKKRPGTE